VRDVLDPTGTATPDRAPRKDGRPTVRVTCVLAWTPTSHSSPSTASTRTPRAPLYVDTSRLRGTHRRHDGDGFRWL